MKLYSAHILSALAILPGVFGCAATTDEIEQTAEADQSIRTGTVVAPFATEARSVVHLGGCTATVVNPSWVLAARHCGTPIGEQAISVRASGVSVQRTVDLVLLHPQIDIEMVHVSQPFTDVPSAPLYAGNTASLIGKTVTCYGYGWYEMSGTCTRDADCGTGRYCHGDFNMCGTPSLDMRKANLVTSYANEDFFVTPMNSQGQMTYPGDSGGPCMLNGAIAGVTSTMTTPTGSGAQVSIESARDFIENAARVEYIPGDFNGDGKKDVLIVTAAGSFWYYSTGTGTWNTTAYKRTDLRLGKVKYTPGDFNGDGKTDLIITTAGGSYWYYSTGTGTWNTTAYSRGDLNLPVLSTDTAIVAGTVKYTPGDFNGDGKTDLIVTTNAGSSWYYSTGTGTWNTSAYSRSDLPLGKVEYTVGDFNGDGRDDVIISTAAGSFWYYSTGTGTWNKTAYNRSDLPIQVASYVPGDFNGDGKDDVIISTSAGSFWYYSTGTGTWNTTAYNRTDLKRGAVTYTVGNFNGDGRDDVIISTAAGSFWYYSTGTGAWNTTAYNRTDLRRGVVKFAAGNFNGSGGDDVIITTALGSFWYYSTGTGTWNTTAYSRTDLPL